MLFLLGLICLLPLTVNAGDELDTNIITADNRCQPFSVRLPYEPDYYILDFENFYFEDDFCYSASDWDRFMKCRLKEDDNGYIATLWVCESEKHIRLSWRMPEFIELAKMSYITQFFMPGGQWKKKNEYCLQPQYSTPLIRTNLTGNSEEIKCVIYRPSCYYSEHIQIYGLYEGYCGGNDPAKACARREIGNDLIEFTTTVPYNPHNATQYVFCVTDRDTLSIQLTWRPEETTTEITATTSQETPSEELTTASDETTGPVIPTDTYPTPSEDTDEPVIPTDTYPTPSEDTDEPVIPTDTYPTPSENTDEPDFFRFSFYAYATSGHHDYYYSVSLRNHDHAVSLPDHDHAVSLPDHDHTVSLPNHDHAVSLPDHDHTVSLPNHDHTMSLPDYETTVSMSHYETTVSFPNNGQSLSTCCKIDRQEHKKMGRWQDAPLLS
ncbi:hypothetical protein SprV_0802642000 [Sparganum proliferum]